MEDFTNVLKSPVVLMAGFAIGAVILFMHSNGGGSPAAVAVEPSNAAYQYFTQSAAYAYQYGIAQINSDAKKTADYFSLLNMLDQHETTLQVERTIVNGGVIQSQIQANSAQILDAQQNYMRLNQSYISASVATHAQDTTLAATRAQTASNIAIAAITAKAGIETAKAEYNAAINAATINAGRDITLGTIASGTSLGVSADQVRIAQINGDASIALAGVTGANLVSLARISADSQFQLKKIDQKISAKKSDNSLIGNIFGGIAKAAVAFL